jgi:NagD protein
MKKQINTSKNYLIDMDGVIVSGSKPIPGASEFIKRLSERNKNFCNDQQPNVHTPRSCSSPEYYRVRYS